VECRVTQTPDTRIDTLESHIAEQGRLLEELSVMFAHQQCTIARL